MWLSSHTETGERSLDRSSSGLTVAHTLCRRAVELRKAVAHHRAAVGEPRKAVAAAGHSWRYWSRLCFREVVEVCMWMEVRRRSSTVVAGHSLQWVEVVEALTPC